MALRGARLAGVMVDDLLVGQTLPPSAGSDCWQAVTSDLEDENTLVKGRHHTTP